MIPISYNIRSLIVRRTTSIATALGIALVVLVLASSMMLVTGIKRTLISSGRPDNAIVVRKGAEFEMMSTIEDQSIPMITVQPQVKKDGNTPMAVGEVVQVIQVEKNGANGFSNVMVRGVPDNAMKFRPDMKMVAGEKPKTGTAECMVGKKIRGRFKNIELGETIELRKNYNVKVTGIFEDNGSSYESEVWGDLETVRKAFRFDSVVSTVRVRLESPAAFEGFQATVEHDKRLGFQVFRENEFYEAQSEGLAILVGVLGTAISVFFSIGAMIGAMITMYGSVANRQREIGTLRALGFPRSNILISFLAESIVLTLIGGMIGAAASLAMGLVTFSMMGNSWSEIVFTFTPTPEIIVKALVAATIMGLLGGFFPAVRAARISAIAAMRGA
jgi:putative ABC transport system permease protein